MASVFAAVAKAATFYLGVLAFSMGVFGLISIFLFQANLSIKGCSILTAISFPIWAWACFKLDEPALRTLTSMLLYSGMLVALFLAIGLVKLWINSPRAIALWHIGILVLAAGVFWYLRSAVVRRNKETDNVRSRPDAV
jgi:hypothetical protein